MHAARLPGVERDYVIRADREDVADDSHFVRVFEADARRVASLRHPAIVAIQDYWREPGSAYLVMRRTHGGSLEDRLERGPLAGGAGRSSWFESGARSTAAAEADIVHGRISANSVLFDNSGQACLADFSFEIANRATTSQDVHDFALLVERCADARDAALREVLNRGLASVDRPTISEFVAMLQHALGDEPVANGGRLANPYKGLRAFDETDAVDFFGRGELVDELLGRLRLDGMRGRLILLVAGSGTGKSSSCGPVSCLGFAEVTCLVRRTGTSRRMLPGGTPFKELAESLRRVAVVDPAQLADCLADEVGIDREIRRIVPGDAQVLLVIDQFEELFTIGDRGGPACIPRRNHARRDCSSKPPPRRGDLARRFYDRPLAFQRFGAAGQRRHRDHLRDGPPSSRRRSWVQRCGSDGMSSCRSSPSS